MVFSYIGVLLLVSGLAVGRGGVGSGLVALVVAVRFGSDGGNDGEENDGDLYSMFKINKISIKLNRITIYCSCCLYLHVDRIVFRVKLMTINCFSKSLYTRAAPMELPFWCCKHSKLSLSHCWCWGLYAKAKGAMFSSSNWVHSTPPMIRSRWCAKQAHSLLLIYVA